MGQSSTVTSLTVTDNDVPILHLRPRGPLESIAREHCLGDFDFSCSDWYPADLVLAFPQVATLQITSTERFGKAMSWSLRIFNETS
jgi:hypothetical protein